MTNLARSTWLVWLALALLAACAPAAAPSPAAPAKEAPKPAAAAEQAQPAAGAAGFKYIVSHGEIVEKARQDDKVRVLSSNDPAANKKVMEGFKKKYPNIDPYIEEFAASDTIADYTHFEKMEGYMGKIVEAFGFPKADLN